MPTGQSNGVLLLVEVPSSQMTLTYVKMKNHQSQLLSSIARPVSALAPGLSQPWPLVCLSHGPWSVSAVAFVGCLIPVEFSGSSEAKLFSSVLCILGFLLTSLKAMVLFLFLVGLYLVCIGCIQQTGSGPPVGCGSASQSLRVFAVLSWYDPSATW